MAEINNNPRTILGNNNNINFNIEQPSRLTRSTKDLRNSLISRNLYTNFNAYPEQPDTTQQIVNSVSSVINAIAPFKSVNLNNTVFARLITLPNTPLTDIGLAVLGQQFAYNFASNVAQETFPTIKLSNIWDGDPNTKLFSENKNFRITNRESATNINNFLERFVGFYPDRYYPFDSNTENSDILRNTGNVQLSYIYSQFNKNLYKPSDRIYDNLDPELSLDKRSDIIYGKGNRSSGDEKIFFNFINSDFNPYFRSVGFITDKSVLDANVSMREAYSQVNTQEYAQNIDFINNLGNTSKINGEFNNETGFDETIDNQIIWGKDGVSDDTNNRLQILRGLRFENDDISENNNISSKFNGETGLLKYTQNLLNASNGRFVDQTRKKFKTNINPTIESFNGSGLWVAPSNDYTDISRISGEVGVRQHTILDQYDRFAKAIRFQGNKVYNGNQNSVINKSVLPRIHPTPDELDNNKINNKNLMFSIENLAVKVFENESYGIIDDEYGTQIPLSEIGPLNGRMMWFPPYGIELTENSTAKYDSNVLVGRTEPIYTYMHSERTATLSFLMIMDYPPQIRNLINSENVNEDFSKFFAFGGNDYLQQDQLDNVELKIQTNIVLIDQIKNKKNTNTPSQAKDISYIISFPNDLPKSGGVNNIIDEMYLNYKYEIIPDLIPDSYGLNQSIYNLEGINDSDPLNPIFNPPTNFSQYTYNGIESELDQTLFNLFNKPEDVKFYKITLIGRSSKLYTPNDTTDTEKQRQYNLALSRRRAEAVMFFIKQRVKNIEGLGSKIAEAITFEINPRGDRDAAEENATVAAISEEDTKRERSVEIIFSQTERTSDPVEPELTPEEIAAIDILIKENNELQKVLNNKNRGSVRSNYVMKERKSNQESNADDGILKGFKSLKDNYFYPAFHSQTPEDFHRRLTFLQQCTRQGSAIRLNTSTDENGIDRARNSAFGRQPICVLRIGDFFNTKVIIENVTYDYTEAPWDLNPEGFGMQPMIAEITVQMKVIGGQSLKGPIDALQNAVSFNYYANSTFTNRGLYLVPSYEEAFQYSSKEGIDSELVQRINNLKKTRNEAIKETLEKSKNDSE